MRAKIIRRDVPASLPKNRMARPRVELTVIGNRQRLLFSGLGEPSHFDVAASLCEDEKAELPKDCDNVGSRKASQFRHRPVPLPS
jgi:hypothetical protein